MPVRDFKLDVNGDLTVENGDFAVVADQDAVAQGIAIRLRLIQSEYWLDESQGVPWLDGILGKPAKSDQEIEEILRAAIAATPDVTKVVSTGFVRGANRTATISYSVLTVYSTTPLQGQVTI